MVTIVKKQWHRILSVVLAIALVINVTPLGMLNVSALPSNKRLTVNVKYDDDSSLVWTEEVHLFSDDEYKMTGYTGGATVYTYDGINNIRVPATESHKEGRLDGTFDKTEETVTVTVERIAYKLYFNSNGYAQFMDMEGNSIPEEDLYISVEDAAAMGNVYKFKVVPAEEYKNDELSFDQDNDMSECTLVEIDSNGVRTYSATLNRDHGFYPASTGVSIVVPDTTPPALTVDPVSTTPATETQITFAATDDGTITYYVSTTDNLTSFAGMETANGTYYVYAVDEAGNIAKTAAVVSNIDRDAPTNLVVGAPDTTPAQSKEITFSATDSSALKYYVSTEADYANVDTTTEATSPYAATANGTYYVYAVDAAGNYVKSDAVTVTGIDTTKPTVSLAANPSGETNSDVTITVTAADDDVVAKVVYGTTSVYEQATELIHDNGVYSFTATATEETGYINTNTYYVWAVDTAGNISDVTSIQVNIDKAAPAFTVTATDGTNAYDADTWTDAEKITVTAESVEATATFKYGTTNVVDDAAAYTAPVEVSAAAGEQVEKTLYFWAVDSLGNTSATPTAFTVKIDRKGAVVNTAAASTSDWTDDDVTISGTVSDEGVGVEKVVYSSTGDFATASVATLNGSDFTFSVTVADDAKFNGDYTVWAVDKFGNVSAPVTVGVKVDKIAPVVNTVTTAVGGADVDFSQPTNWTKENVIVSVDATDSDSKIEKVVYGKTDNRAQATEEATLDAVSGKYTFTVTDTEYKDKYYVWAQDKAGNWSDAGSVVIKIDSTKPEAGTPVANPADWTNSSVEISGTATDANLTAKIVYSTAAMTADQVLDATSGVVANTENDAEFAYTFTVPNKAEYNGDYYVYAVDAAGNVSAASDVEVLIDIKAPEVDTIKTTVYNEAASEVEMDFAQTNVWTNKNVTVKGTVSDAASQTANSGIAKVVYSTDGTLQEAAVKALTTVADYANGEYSFVVENSTEFNGTYYVWAIDVAGNVSAAGSIAVKIETTEPAVTGLFHEAGATDVNITSTGSTDNYYYFNAAMDVYTTYEDTNAADAALISGVAKLEYSVNQQDWVPAQTLESVYSLTELNKHHTVWARVTDYAGNVSPAVNTKIIILDDQKPVDGSSTADAVEPIIQIAHSGTILNDIYSSDVTLEISVMDPLMVNGAMADIESEDTPDGGVLSGLKTVYYKVATTDTTAEVESDTLLTGGTKIVYGDFIHKWSDTLTVNAADFNSNNVVVTAWAEDNAGNRSDEASVTFKIDVTLPEVVVDFENNSAENDKYFQDNRTAVISVKERNFDPANTKWIINGAEKVVAAENWTKTDGTLPNGDDTVWTTKVAFTDEGDYKFNISTVKDLAGNEATNIRYNGTAPNEFTIDKTNPKIKVSYSNNSAVNEKYFDAYRTATISIKERNFDKKLVDEKITASLNGVGIAEPEVSWRSSSDSHTATIRYEADGDYTFDIAMTDLAGRKNKGVDYGDSVAPEEFTIDTTIEKPIISGVENGAAYKERVAPAISFNDVNYMSHTISLLRTRMGERNVDVTAELLGAAAVTAQGFTLTAANFEEIRENDGIYTLTVTATDRAGNEEMETVTFTVNRFGSVYVFSEYLADLVSDGGRYVPAVEEDLVITEYNPDRLVEGSLLVEITRDGKPIDAVFSVNPEINEYVTVGESGWFQYRYTMDAANFAADGIYKIYVSSQDETGNYPETANFEDMDILFRVDSTAPEITSVVGLEESIVNAQELEVKYSLFDAIALKSVKLYVNGELAEEITDFTDMNNYEGKFVLAESSSRQSVRLVVEDMAGNITDTSAENFESAYVFNSDVTVSTNIFVRWFANKPLFFGSIGGVGAAAAAAWYFLIFKRREGEEA